MTSLPMYLNTHAPHLKSVDDLRDSDKIAVTAINEPGSLAEIAQVIAAHDANIHTLSMGSTAPDFSELIIDLEVWDLKHLNRLLSQLKENASVSEVRRVNG